MKNEQMRQTRLERKVDDVVENVVGWTTLTPSNVGNKAEVLPNDGKGLYIVTDVFEPPMSAAELKEKQRLDRGSLPSIA